MYVKLFAQIFDSTLAEDYLERLVFTDLLTLADQDGCVDMTLNAISRRTNVPLEIVRAAIEQLCQPDPESRSPEEDGRRIVLMSADRAWGWRIVNYLKYRKTVDDETRRAQNRERKQKQRDRERGSHGSSRNVTPVTLGHAISRQAEVKPEAKAEAEARTEEATDAGGAGGGAPASEVKVGEKPGPASYSSFSLTARDGDAAPAVPDGQSHPAASENLAPTAALQGQRSARVLIDEEYDGTRSGTQTGHTHAAPPVGPHRLTEPTASPDTTWDALDFAMENREEFEGLGWKELRRVMFYHWRVAKAYWCTPAGGVNSQERLKKVLPTLVKQTPTDFKVPGSATIVLPAGVADPDCAVCRGQGFTPGPNEAYLGELEYLQADPCSCAITNGKPWKTWKKETVTSDE